MANINFNYSEVYGSANKVREIADFVGTEEEKINAIISIVQSSWIGTGAAEYISYLEAVKASLTKQAQDLYDISNAMNNSAYAAEEADREAARLLAEQRAREEAAAREAAAAAEREAAAKAAAARDAAAKEAAKNKKSTVQPSQSKSNSTPDPVSASLNIVKKTIFGSGKKR